MTTEKRENPRDRIRQLAKTHLDAQSTYREHLRQKDAERSLEEQVEFDLRERQLLVNTTCAKLEYEKALDGYLKSQGVLK